MAVVKCTFGSAACVLGGGIQPYGQSVFIKFCRSYGTAAHQAMAAAGYAPALLDLEQLVQGCLLIDAMPYDEMVDKPVEPPKAAVHAAGFVHGDLRGCNILTATSAMYLVDFNGQGSWGDLCFINHIENQRADGAGDGDLVTVS